MRFLCITLAAVAAFSGAAFADRPAITFDRDISALAVDATRPERFAAAWDLAGDGVFVGDLTTGTYDVYVDLCGGSLSGTFTFAWPFWIDSRKICKFNESTRALEVVAIAEPELERASSPAYLRQDPDSVTFVFSQVSYQPDAVSRLTLRRIDKKTNVVVDRTISGPLNVYFPDSSQFVVDPSMDRLLVLSHRPASSLQAIRLVEVRYAEATGTPFDYATTAVDLERFGPPSGLTSPTWPLTTEYSFYSTDPNMRAVRAVDHTGKEFDIALARLAGEAIIPVGNDLLRTTNHRTVTLEPLTNYLTPVR